MARFPVVTWSVVESFADYFGFGQEIGSPAFAGAVWVLKLAAACPIPRGYTWKASDENDTSQPSIYVADSRPGRRQKVSYSHPLDPFFTCLIDQILAKCSRLHRGVTPGAICFLDHNSANNSFYTVGSPGQAVVNSLNLNQNTHAEVAALMKSASINPASTKSPPSKSNRHVNHAKSAAASKSTTAKREFSIDDIAPAPPPAPADLPEDQAVPPPDSKFFDEAPNHSMPAPDSPTNQQDHVIHADAEKSLTFSEIDAQMDHNTTKNETKTVEKRVKVAVTPPKFVPPPPRAPLPVNQPTAPNEMPAHLAELFKTPTDMEIVQIEEFTQAVRDAESASEIYENLAKLRDLRPSIKLIRECKLQDFLKTYSCDMDTDVRQLAKDMKGGWKAAVESAREQLQEWINAKKSSESPKHTPPPAASLPPPPTNLPGLSNLPTPPSGGIKIGGSTGLLSRDAPPSQPPSSLPSPLPGIVVPNSPDKKTKPGEASSAKPRATTPVPLSRPEPASNPNAWVCKLFSETRDSLLKALPPNVADDAKGEVDAASFKFSLDSQDATILEQLMMRVVKWNLALRPARSEKVFTTIKSIKHQVQTLYDVRDHAKWAERVPSILSSLADLHAEISSSSGGEFVDVDEKVGARSLAEVQDLWIGDDILDGKVRHSFKLFTI